MSEKKKRNRNSNLRVFLTILLVVASISIMIKLNRNFSFTVKIPLTFQNLSEDYILKKSSTTSVKVTGKASGYDYFKYRFFSQAFPIDLSNLPKDGKESYYVFNKESDALKGSLSGSEIIAFEPDTVFFLLDRNYDKRVPVVSNFDISYSPGYGSFQGMQITPDSITVRGPESEVDTITVALDKRLSTEDPAYPKRLQHHKEIYIGHTPVTRINEVNPTKMANVWNVDTGAAFKGCLSIIDVDTKQFWQSDPLYKLYPEEQGRN